jgi:periodic tryptophan protein 2
MTTPRPAQLLCLAVDGGGEVVVAGAMEPFEIYVWSLQTGRLLDVLTGHEAPVSCLAFSPTEPLLASGSWVRRSGDQPRHITRRDG